MGLINDLLQPLYYAVAWILVSFHAMWSTILPEDSGAAWTLSIVGLVVVIRILLIPLFVKQITSEGFFLRHLHRERVDNIRLTTAVRAQAGKAMGQQFQSWRSGSGQNSWLAMLVDAMEKASRPELRAVPCDSRVLAALRAQLARPATAHMPYATGYSLRN